MPFLAFSAFQYEYDRKCRRLLFRWTNCYYIININVFVLACEQALRGALAAGQKRRVLPASTAVFNNKKYIPREEAN